MKKLIIGLGLLAVGFVFVSHIALAGAVKPACCSKADCCSASSCCVK